jgi:hypothetical protein
MTQPDPTPPEPELSAEEIEALRKLAETAMAAFQEWKSKPGATRWRAATKAEEAFRDAVDPSDVLRLLSALAAERADGERREKHNLELTKALAARERERNGDVAEIAALRRENDSLREKVPQDRVVVALETFNSMGAERDALRAELAARERRIQNLELTLAFIERADCETWTIEGVTSMARAALAAEGPK